MAESLHEGHRARLRAAAQNDPDLASFSDYQTLEYLLSFLIPRKDTNPIAHNLIDEFGSLNAVFHASSEELYDIPNMTHNAAVIISSLYSIIRKSEMSRIKAKQQLARISDAVDFLRPYFIGRYEERIYCVALDINDKVLQLAPISEGNADSATINNNKLFSIITRNKAKKIILAHNHPAGSLQPSAQDINVTRSYFLILQTLDAVLSDHLIFTDEGYFSFYEHGILDDMALSPKGNYGNNSYEEVRARKLQGIYVYEPKNSDNSEKDE